MTPDDIQTARKSGQTEAPIVETVSGKVGGATTDGIHGFKGIPYGAPTSGANRFMAPRPPAEWAGVREALKLAGRSPQAKFTAQRPELATVWGPIDELPVGEDCLTLHLWTPGLEPQANRPVMVWLHGGAFSYGSANVPRFDGANLARRGDVVVVAVNHRLNIFGHLDLSQIAGPDFKSSGNAGVLDLVAALEWVRDNVAAFGGDPASVTVFGQSGGGGKISTLLAMPAAAGLFHRAIIQSGATIRVRSAERAHMLSEAILKALGLAKGDLAKLQTLPIAKLVAAIEPAIATLPKPAHPLLDRYPFGPVVDGHDLPCQPFDPEAPTLSDHVPILIGDTKDEAAIFLAPDDRIWSRQLTEAELRAEVAKVAGPAADELIEIYRRRAPKADPAELLIAALTGSNFWVRSILLAERQAARGKAPVYMYNFAWETPIHGRRLKASHSVDTAFVFDTVGAIGAATSGRLAAELAATVSTAWANFARTGVPAAPKLSVWPAYSAADRAVMVLNSESRLVRDPDTEARKLLCGIA
ncbi:MAG: carboxylesterase/lipase family protein [Alphaproteobacteria bacterium]|nr:carboxylesterase/lipase family protein [Alphaproteobacteria bacterium]